MGRDRSIRHQYMLCLSMEEGERLKEAALYAGVFHGRAEQGILLCYSSASLSWRVTDVPRLSASQSASEGKGTKQTGRNQAGQKGRCGNPAAWNAKLTA